MGFFRRNEQSHQTPENQEETADTKMQEAERSHVEGLKAAFQESWEKNHREDDPDVLLEMLLSPHVDEKDVPSNLRSKLEGADIYMLEASGWTRSDMRKWNSDSKGKMKSRGFSGYATALQEAVQETGVLVMSPDIRRRHPSVEEGRRLRAEYDDIVSLPFHEAAQKYDEHLRARAARTQKREMEVMNNIPVLIRKALNKNKALRKKKSLSVIMTYGSMHTALYHALSATEISATREMGETLYPRSAELMRRYIFGVGGTERDLELSARALIEDVFFGASNLWLKAVGANTAERTVLSRLVVDRLSAEDLSEIWDVQLDASQGNVSITPQWTAAVLAAFEKTGFTMPKTREELDELLQSERK